MRVGKAMVSGVALLALVAGAGAVAVSRVDPEAVKDFLTDAARQATGREVVVRGATELRLLPTPTLIAENVVFGNAPWSVSPDMARVKRLEARVGILPLFMGQLRISRFRLLEPHVLLEQDKKGRRNWDFQVEKQATGENEFLAQMRSRVRMVGSEIQIVDGTFSYREGKSTRTIRIPHLSANGDTGGGPLGLTGRGQFNGRGWKLSGRVGELSALLRNEPYGLAFVVSSGGTRITGDGAIERPLDGTGLRMDVKLEARSGREMLAMVGLDVDLRGSVQASAELIDIDDGVRLDKLRAKARIDGGYISASGTVANLVGMRGVSLKLGVKAKSVAGIVRLAGAELPKAGPVTASARITNPKGRYRMDKL
ncbi:MAG: AsmA family protein, partial [Proteobacteria bacterium]|nr:AsmA family protein [Pseudomonadota bacterium]